MLPVNLCSALTLPCAWSSAPKGGAPDTIPSLPGSLCGMRLSAGCLGKVSAAGSGLATAAASAVRFALNGSMSNAPGAGPKLMGPFATEYAITAAWSLQLYVPFQGIPLIRSSNKPLHTCQLLICLPHAMLMPFLPASIFSLLPSPPRGLFQSCDTVSSSLLVRSHLCRFLPMPCRQGGQRMQMYSSTSIFCSLVRC